MYKDKIEWRNYTRISDQSPRGRNRFYEGRHIKWPLYTCYLIHVKFSCSSQWLLYMNKSNHDTKSFSEPVSVTFVRGLVFKGRGDFQQWLGAAPQHFRVPKKKERILGRNSGDVQGKAYEIKLPTHSSRGSTPKNVLSQRSCCQSSSTETVMMTNSGNSAEVIIFPRDN